MKNIKLLCLVVLGNILEYYDFLLFMHIGHLIIPQFIPEHYAEQSHVFALVLFALPFLIRPAGGYFFGKMADATSTTKALDSTLSYASIASLLIAVLPGYHAMGVLSTTLFIVLRALQGFALGGEYTTAGTLLMDQFPTKRSLISGILGASGTIGSIVAFVFSLMYSEYVKGTEIWRTFFLFGGVATYVSYYLRKHHLSHLRNPLQDQESQSCAVEALSIYKTLVLGAVTSVSCFIPMVYSNFYITKVLGHSSGVGLSATFLSLVGYIIFTPMVGYISDRLNLSKAMPKTFMMAMPLAVMGFVLLHKGWLFGQIPLTLAASLAGANIHVVMNHMFPLATRSRNVNLYFTIGASMGGLVPALSGYLSVNHHFVYTPFLAVTILLALSAYLFAKPLHTHKVSAEVVEGI